MLSLILAVGSCAPIDFEYADGAAGRYSDWRGHWVFINYWAEWCAPCRYEIPQLNALSKARARERCTRGGRELRRRRR